MKNKHSLALLIIIMTVIVLSVGAMTFYELYHVAITKERAWLANIAKSQAGLIEAVARFDAKHSMGDHLGGAVAATLSQIKDAHGRHRGFGKTGEFTLAKREGEKIVFLLKHRHHNLDNPEPIHFNSDLGEPMRRALSGLSGTMIGFDYRGEKVLAAHEPVAELNLGIVAKMDMAEIRAPFIKSGVKAAGGAIVLILLGSLLFIRITNPLIRKLQKSEESLKKAQEVANMGSWEFDLNSNKTYWSDELYRIYGVNPQDCKPSHELFLSMVHMDDKKKIEEFFYQDRTDNKVYEIEFRLVKPDGEERIIYNQFVIDFDDAGKPARMTGINMDITERKRAEESQTRLGRILDKSSSEIYIFDPGTLNLMMVNMNARLNLGLTEEEMMKLKICDFNVEHNERKFKNVIKPIHDGETESISFLTSHKRADGSSYPVELSVGIISEETPPVYVAVAQDITERKRAEDKLKESEIMFRSITQTALVAIITADSSGRIVTWNRGAEDLFGYGENEIKGKSITLIMPERFWEKHNEGLERVRATGKSAIAGKRLELFGLKKDGSEFPFTMTIAYWETEKGIFFSVVIIEKANKEQEDE